MFGMDALYRGLGWLSVHMPVLTLLGCLMANWLIVVWLDNGPFSPFRLIGRLSASSGAAGTFVLTGAWVSLAIFIVLVYLLIAGVALSAFATIVHWTALHRLESLQLIGLHQHLLLCSAAVCAMLCSVMAFLARHKEIVDA